MADAPWLTIIGVGEDGPGGLTPASREALKGAEIVMGPARHLGLLSGFGSERIEWPVPFADGIPQLLGLRGRKVAVLASGDPFWFGAGSVLARHLGPEEWRAFPGPSTFSLAVNRLGWALDEVATLGLHAAPFERLRPVSTPGGRAIVLLRDGAAVGALGSYLCSIGFGASELWILEALGGPKERVTSARADALPAETFNHPVCVAIAFEGDGQVLSKASGRADTWFDHDGQITKQPVRAMTLSALVPKPGEHLWDIGAGSGSISIEWLLSDPSLDATAIEANPERVERITANARRLGVDRLNVINGTAPAALDGLATPQAVFVGGGLDRELIDWLTGHLATGTRLVANGVTLESEALLIEAHARLGGDLMRVEISKPNAIGTRTGWKAAYPITQWSVTL